MACCTCLFYKYNQQKAHLDISQEDQEMAQKQTTNASFVQIHRAGKM